MTKYILFPFLALCLLSGAALAQTPDIAATSAAIIRTDDEIVHPKLGLWTVDGQALPLSDISTKVQINGAYAQVQHTQVFQNSNEQEVELVYFYSKAEDTIVDGIGAAWNKGQVQAELIKKQVAENTFNKMSAEAIAASSVEQYDQPAVVIGKVPAKTAVTVQVSLIQPLYVVANQFLGYNLHSSILASANLNTESWQNSANLSQAFEGATAKKWKVQVVVTTPSQLTKALNPSHNIQPTNTKKGNDFVATWQSDITLDKDFVVFYTHAKVNEPSYAFAEHPVFDSDWTFSVNLLPQMNNILDADIAADIQAGKSLNDINLSTLPKDTASARGEYIFAIDTNNNIAIDHLTKIKTAVTQLLKKLPSNSLFNIVAFGDKIVSYKSTGQVFASLTYNDAINWLNSKVKASTTGAKDLQEAIKQINGMAQNNRYPRTVFVFSASSTNQDNILNDVYANQATTRYCAIGLGDTDADLMKNIGQLGNCGSQIVADGEAIEDKASGLFNASISPYMNAIKISYNCNNTKGNTVFNQTYQDNIVLKGEYYQKTIFFGGFANPNGCAINVSYYNGFTNIIYSRWYSFRGFTLAEINDAYHKIGAAAQIQALEDQALITADDTNITKQIADIATKYQVANDIASWVSYDQTKKVYLADSIIALFKPANSNDNTTAPGDNGNNNGTDTGNNTNPEPPANNGTDNSTAPGNNTNPEPPLEPSDMDGDDDDSSVCSFTSSISSSSYCGEPPADNGTIIIIPGNGTDNNNTNSTNGEDGEDVDIPIDTPGSGIGNGGDVPANSTNSTNNNTNNNNGNHNGGSLGGTVVIIYPNGTKVEGTLGPNGWTISLNVGVNAHHSSNNSNHTANASLPVSSNSTNSTNSTNPGNATNSTGNANSTNSTNATNGTQSNNSTNTTVPEAPVLPAGPIPEAPVLPAGPISENDLETVLTDLANNAIKDANAGTPQEVVQSVTLPPFVPPKDDKKAKEDKKADKADEKAAKDTKKADDKAAKEAEKAAKDAEKAAEKAAKDAKKKKFL